MVYVLNSDGSPLMPCTEAKARHLIEGGKAKVVRRTPFTIRLTFLVEGLDIRTLDRPRIHAGVHCRQLTLVERSNTNLMYKEVMEVPSSGRA